MSHDRYCHPRAGNFDHMADCNVGGNSFANGYHYFDCSGDSCHYSDHYSGCSYSVDNYFDSNYFRNRCCDVDYSTMARLLEVLLPVWQQKLQILHHHRYIDSETLVHIQPKMQHHHRTNDLFFYLDRPSYYPFTAEINQNLHTVLQNSLLCFSVINKELTSEIKTKWFKRIVFD